MDAKRAPVGNRRLRRARRAALVLLALLAIYVLAGVIGTPLVVRHVILPRVEERLDGTISVERIRANPLTLSIELDDLAVRDSAGDVHLALERFEGNFQLLSTLFRTGWHFRRAVVTRPHVRAELSREGNFNLLDLIRLPKPDRSDVLDAVEGVSELPRVVIGRLAVIEAALAVRDERPADPYVGAIEHLNFAIDGLDTQPDFDNLHRLVATAPTGERVSWTGDFRVDPLSSHGTISLSDLSLPALGTYASILLDGRVAAGRVSFDLSYDFSLGSTDPKARVVLHSARVRDLAIERAGEALIQVPELDIENAVADESKRHLSISLIRSRRTHIFATRDERGRLPLRDLFKNMPGQESAGTITGLAGTSGEGRDRFDIVYPILRLLVEFHERFVEAPQPWELEIQRVEVEEYTLDALDLRPREPVQVTVRDVRIGAGPIRSSESYRTPFALEMTVDEGGHLAIEGKVAPSDGSASLDVRAQDVDLSSLAPYAPLEPTTLLPPITLESALLFLDGHVEVSIDEANTVSFGWQGDARLDGVEVNEAHTGAAVMSAGRLETRGAFTLASGSTIDASFEGEAGALELSLHAAKLSDAEIALGRLTVLGIEFDQSERRAAASEIVFERPTLRALARILPRDEEPAESAPSSEASDAGDDGGAAAGAALGKWSLAAGRIEVRDGSLDLRDTSADPPALVNLTALAFEAHDFASASGPVAFELDGRLHESGRLRISGTADPLRSPPQLDVRVSIVDLPVEPHEPASAAYVGHLVESGRLTLDLPIRIDEGRLDGTLDARFDVLHLGDAVESEHALDVPVKFGLDLLRDKNDRIEIKVPISGNVNDPEFSVGSIIVDAFLGLLVKAATAPFQLLASIFAADSDQDLSHVAFEAGSAEVGSDALAVLDTLARAMQERPALDLAAVGRVNREIDGPAVRSEMLHEMALEELQRITTVIDTLTPEAYRSRVAVLYAERILRATGAGEGAPSAAAPAALPPFEEMQAALLATIEVPEERYRTLARQRAEAVVARLGADGGIDSARASVREAEPDALEAESPRADFELQ